MIAVAQTKSIFEFAFEFFIKVAEPKKGFYLNLYPQKKFQIKIIKFLIEFQKACLPPSFIKIFLSKKTWITIWCNRMPIIFFCKNEIMQIETIEENEIQIHKRFDPTVWSVTVRQRSICALTSTVKPWRSNLKSAALTCRIFLSDN